MAVRDRHERVRLRRPRFSDRGLDQAREAVRGRDGEQREDEREEAAPHEREQEPERKPDEAVRSDPRQEDEDVVERGPPMVDDPPLG